jgi:hypothetical protein
MTDNTKRYIGLADCHGIESFFEEGSDETWTFGLLNLRANLNPHRFAVAFKVDLALPVATLIRDLLDAGDFKEALLTLKTVAKEWMLSNESNAELMKAIPNSKLDPYGGDYEGKENDDGEPDS